MLGVVRARGPTPETALTRIGRASAVFFFVLTGGFVAPAESATFRDCNVKPSSSLVVNVKERGAKGDGKTDDTDAIRKSVKEVAGTGGTVYVPRGTYLIRAHGAKRINLESKMTFRLADGATLKAIPNAERGYSLLRIRHAKDVNVVGGMLQGERYQHKGRQGEWGMGIIVGPETRRITISGVTSRHMWGDGFYVQGAKDVAFCSVVAEHNRRQGLSVVKGNRILVTNSVFRDTRGTAPSAGIDLEPDKREHRISNVRIQRSKFINNAGGGVMIAGKKAQIANVEILDNYFEGPRPILVENAPKVRSTSICDNRFVRRETADAGGFNTFSDAVEVVSLQTDCKQGRDMRFEKNRQTVKKLKH